MIVCSICKTKNDQYSTICKVCGSYLQNRVPNIDLFGTIWKIIENPKIAFKLIVLAEHKNYSILLYVLFGISIAFTELWLFRLGDKYENILTLILWALLTGIPTGIVLCPIVSCLHWILTNISGGKTSYRISLGITSYSLTPIIISLLLLLPIKLLTFGMYLFTFNPHPMLIKPLSYVILTGFDTILTAWAFILLIVGTKVGNQISLVKSILINTVLYIFIWEVLKISITYVVRLL
jgi:hypothetical protein